MSTLLSAPPALRIGSLALDAPVVLAPMAGITNTAFRRLCREYGAGLYVSEMITTRALVERNTTTMRLIRHHESETPRSIQLYGVDPATVEAAVRILVDEDHADHIDLNFGCPVPKVTRKGGGAALPWKRDLFRDIVTRATRAAQHIPLTVKMRKGIDADHLTFLDAGRIAEDAGVAAVALHARTAAEFYSGTADWEAIAALKEAVTGIPVLGNGDIWSADDAVRMMAQTGCDGVVVGRGCLGRPWLFGDLAAALAPHRSSGGLDHRSLSDLDPRSSGGLDHRSLSERSETKRVEPSPRRFDSSSARSMTGGATADGAVDATLGFVAQAFRRHAALLVEFFEDEDRGCRDIRKHVAWYLKGYPVGGETRARLATVSSLAEIDDLLATLDLDAPYPGAAAEGQRGRAGSPKRPALPDRWLESREIDAAESCAIADAELDHSGG